MRASCIIVVGLWGFTLGGNTPAADIEPLLEKIRTVGREGAGAAEAARAWKQLAAQTPETIPSILTAMNTADAVAFNWLRSAVDAIAERSVTAKQQLPVKELESFLLNTKNAPRARRQAYEWLVRVDPKAPARLLPGFMNDPSVELRRDAVAVVMDAAQQSLTKGDKDASKSQYQTALASARDRDQVDAIAKQLKTLGKEVDLASHFGFIRQWKLIGPFDSTGGVGFAIAYPPEKEVVLNAALKGKKDATLRWIDHATTDAYGMVDLNKALGKNMGAAAYAFAVVNSDREQPVEMRAGTKNAIKIFLNGKQLFFREEYHHGLRMDQHVGVGTLKQGRNEVLVKICQNEQTEDWAQDWSFQLRLSDSVGGAVPYSLVTGKTEGKEQR